jgi:hypothetical protein
VLLKSSLVSFYTLYVKKINDTYIDSSFYLEDFPPDELYSLKSSLIEEGSGLNKGGGSSSTKILE